MEIGKVRKVRKIQVISKEGGSHVTVHTVKRLLPRKEGDAEHDRLFSDARSRSSEFIQRCYAIRSERGSRHERRLVREAWVEVFGKAPSGKLPFTVRQSQIYYRILLDDFSDRGILHWLSQKVLFHARAMLAVQSGYAGLEVETERLCRLIDESGEIKEGLTMAKKKEATESGVGRARYLVMGFPVTAVCRRLGKEGLTVGQVRSIMVSLKCPVNPSTIMIQVHRGRKGDGEPAALTGVQLKELRSHITEEKKVVKAATAATKKVAGRGEPPTPPKKLVPPKKTVGSSL